MTALYDHGGNKIARFGFAGIKRVLKDPIKITEDCKQCVYAMVWSEESEVFIIRYGAGKDFKLIVQYWTEPLDYDTDDDPVEEVFSPKEFDKGIKKFMKLCKRDPLYVCT